MTSIIIISLIGIAAVLLCVAAALKASVYIISLIIAISVFLLSEFYFLYLTDFAPSPDAIGYIGILIIPAYSWLVFMFFADIRNEGK